MIDLFEELNIKDSVAMPCLNTGTMYDYILGEYELGVNNVFYLNGGIAPMNALSGRGGTYKSTTADALITKVLKIYPDAKCLKLDTENNAFGKKRFVAMGGEEVADRIRVLKSSEESQEAFLKRVDAIKESKLKHKKDFTVETPFNDIYTGKPLRMLVPTIVSIDSFTLFRSVLETQGESLGGVGDSSRNMDDMTDGRLKRKILMQFSRIAAQAGIYFILVAQVGNNISVDQNPKYVNKQIPNMSQKDRLKGVSDMFTFLTNNLIQFNKPDILLSSDKGNEYTDGDSYSGLYKVNSTVVRCKTNGDGSVVPFIVSQYDGIRDGVTHYDFLKEHGDYGLEKRGYNRYTKLVPDVALHRKSMVEVLENNYELSRSLEILTQLYWINNNWNLKGFPVELPRSAEDFYELLEKKPTLRDDILNSRGYWTYNKKDPRKYMGMIEIIKLLRKG